MANKQITQPWSQGSNSGFKSKKGNLKSNKKITISILKEIDPNLDGQNFIKTLEENIYKELDQMI